MMNFLIVVNRTPASWWLRLENTNLPGLIRALYPDNVTPFQRHVRAVHKVRSETAVTRARGTRRWQLKPSYPRTCQARVNTQDIGNTWTPHHAQSGLIVVARVVVVLLLIEVECRHEMSHFIRMRSIPENGTNGTTILIFSTHLKVEQSSGSGALHGKN